MSLNESMPGRILKYGDEATVRRGDTSLGTVIAWLTESHGHTYAHLTPADAQTLLDGDEIDIPTLFLGRPDRRVARSPYAETVRVTPLKEENHDASQT